MGKRGNGEGSIYYSEKLKRWVGQYTYNGKRKSVYGKTRTEVRDKLNKALVNIADNKYIEKSNYTLIDMINQNIEEEFASNKISEITYKRKKDTKKIIEKHEISQTKIQKVNIQAINNFLLTLINYSDSVIAKVSQMVRQGLDRAVLLNIISTNPYSISNAINVPKSNNRKKEVKALTIEENKLFIKELEKNYDTYNDIFYIAIYTGMRVGEILALYNEDIDFQNNLIHIHHTITKDKNGNLIVKKTTKTGEGGERYIPITYLIKDILINICKKNNDLLFTENNKLIAPSTINSHCKKICKNANIQTKTVPKKKQNKKGTTIVNLKTSNVHTHMLRHTYATRCIESGMSAVVLSKLLGHADIETTLNTYTSVFNKFKEDEIQKYIDYIRQLH